MSLYQVPIDMIAHLAHTSHYFLLFDVHLNETTGHIVCHFTEDGVKHLDFYPSRSEAIFKTFEETYLTSKLELLRYTEITSKTVEDLLKVFASWTKPFNLILSNCRNFASYIQRTLLQEDNNDENEYKTISIYSVFLMFFPYNYLYNRFFLFLLS